MSVQPRYHFHLLLFQETDTPTGFGRRQAHIRPNGGAHKILPIPSPKAAVEPPEMAEYTIFFAQQNYIAHAATPCIWNVCVCACGSAPAALSSRLKNSGTPSHPTCEGNVKGSGWVKYSSEPKSHTYFSPNPSGHTHVTLTPKQVGCPIKNIPQLFPPSAHKISTATFTQRSLVLFQIIWGRITLHRARIDKYIPERRVKRACRDLTLVPSFVYISSRSIQQQKGRNAGGATLFTYNAL